MKQIGDIAAAAASVQVLAYWQTDTKHTTTVFSDLHVKC